LTAYGMVFKAALFLAPLSGYTSWPMRMLCREQGAELCYTEMISAAGLLRKAGSARAILKRPEGDRPLIAQIFTSSASEAAQAARVLEDEGFDGIDINMGCPVKKVVGKGAGVALMTDPAKALSLVEAVVRSVDLPVSVKLRAGWDASSMNACECASLFEAVGIDTVVLHPRTRTDMYRGTPRWGELERLARTVKIPVVASGDIRGVEDVERARSLGARAFMVGRGAIGNPWIFRQLLGGGPPSLEEREDVMIRHLDALCSLHGSRLGVLHMRKFLSPYVKGVQGAARFRAQACTIDNPKALEAAVRDFFASQTGKAP